MAPLDTVYAQYRARGRAAADVEAGIRTPWPAELARGAFDPSLARRTAFAGWARGWCDGRPEPVMPPDD